MKPNPVFPKREICMWLVDQEGGKGKTMLKMMIESSTETIVIQNISKLSDLCDQFRRQYEFFPPSRPARILVVDLPRASIESVYLLSEFFGFIEGVLDGCIQCDKYTTKKLNCNFKVYVFSNNFYHEFKAKVRAELLSDDRLPYSSIIDLSRFDRPHRVNDDADDGPVVDMFSQCQKKGKGARFVDRNVFNGMASQGSQNSEVIPDINHDIQHSQNDEHISQADSVHFDSEISQDVESSVGSWLRNTNSQDTMSQNTCHNYRHPNVYDSM